MNVDKIKGESGVYVSDISDCIICISIEAEFVRNDSM